MKRRTLLQLIAAAPIAVPFRDVLLFAQPRELTPAAIAALHDIAPTVLPTILGDNGARQVADKFVAWVRGYREGVALTHGSPRVREMPPIVRTWSELLNSSSARSTFTCALVGTARTWRASRRRGGGAGAGAGAGGSGAGAGSAARASAS